MPDHPNAPDPPQPIAQGDGDVSTEAFSPTEVGVHSDLTQQSQSEESGGSEQARSAQASGIQTERRRSRRHEILAVAVFEPLEGMEAQALATVRELSTVLSRAGYSRDMLYREPGGAYVLVRYWKSDEARRHAPEEPEAQRCWARLSHEIRIIKVYERLEEVPR